MRWDLRVAALEDREYQMDRLEFVKNQLNLLIDDIKKKIKAISEEVESKVKTNAGGRTFEDGTSKCWAFSRSLFC